MAKYQAPKRQLHRDFVYLDHETVINSLSAFEAGRIDEIIEKTSESADRGFDGAVNIRALKAGASKKKEAELHEELVRKRTRFSAFEGWYQQLKGEEAIGTFEEWDQEVRDSLGVGDTIEFRASVRLSPLYLLFRTFGSYANEAGRPPRPRRRRTRESWSRGPAAQTDRRPHRCISTRLSRRPTARGSLDGSPRTICCEGWENSTDSSTS
jgi:hypothetical protein